MKVAIHITHEAVQKIGGIGSVIHGLCSSENYKGLFDRTLLYGPLFSMETDVFSRLGKGGKVLYSSWDNFDIKDYHYRFLPIIQKYKVNIVYGKRLIANEYNINKKNEVDVLLIDVKYMEKEEINIFKFRLWESFQIQSHNYDSIWDYEQYLRIGVVYMDIIKALYPDALLFYHFSHEYMGVPCSLAVLMDKKNHVHHKTIFYAHEVSPSRSVVEKDPGHDISFYNLMKQNLVLGRSFEDEYEGKKQDYRKALIKNARKFDFIFAVGDWVKDEYRYLVPDVNKETIKTVYNGIPLKYIGPEVKLEKRELVSSYINNLFNYNPDIIFTHVTRMVQSKGIWRDITFLYILDEIFQKHSLRGIYILLSTLIGSGRFSSDVYRMEAEYGWPVNHKVSWPDLVGMEEEINGFISVFNGKSKRIKALFINQFGFNKRRCGSRVPDDIEFMDLRIASDAEFGFSIYEPFGIAQLEVVPFGGIAALSSSCGSAFLLKETFKKSDFKPYHIINFIEDAEKHLEGVDLRHLSPAERFDIEKSILKTEASNFFSKLPKNNQERKLYLENAQECINHIGWEKIVEYVAGAIKEI